ncbi:hypothetical protein ABES25_21130 [Bacillus gobiensis]|uniref:hypothetical protein n=1 Tax=Bacillus gobiensis TaxID=1441095 RepID=UPI003D1A7C62
MKQMPFERPTDHYDERILSIDEQICALLKQRKEISNNNPGFPPLEEISRWVEEYGHHEEFLRAIFLTLMDEDEFLPVVEPKDFRKYISVLKSVEQGEYLYTVTYIRQYSNASVVNLNIDWHDNNVDRENREHHKFFELYINDHFNCSFSGGSGSEGQMTNNYIISPPLPDDISGFDFVFKEKSAPFHRKSTGNEIVIHAD